MTALRAEPCSACGGSEFADVPYPAAGAAASSLRFESIRVCARCGLGQALPSYPQSTLDAFYAGGGYWAATGATPAQSMHARNQCAHRARFVAGRTPPVDRIRVLDVGAGEGWLVGALREGIGARISDYHYVEPNARLRSRHELPGGPARRGFADLSEIRGPYELVFLNQVLEHVADPTEFLGRIVNLLAVEGVLYVESPNADYRFKAEVFPHTLFFTAESMSRLAARCGFETLVCESFGRSTARRSGLGDLAARVGYRFAVGVGAGRLAQRFDDAYWNYSPRPDGLWLRWLGRKAGTD